MDEIVLLLVIPFIVLIFVYISVSFINRYYDEEMAKEYTNNLLKDVNCTIGNPRARQIKPRINQNNLNDLLAMANYIIKIS